MRAVDADERNHRPSGHDAIGLDDREQVLGDGLRRTAVAVLDHAEVPVRQAGPPRGIALLRPAPRLRLARDRTCRGCERCSARPPIRRAREHRHESYTMRRVSRGFVALASGTPSVWVKVLVGIPPNIVERPISVSGLLKTRTQIRSVFPTLRM